MPRISPEERVVKKTMRKLESTLRKMEVNNSTAWENTFVEDVKAKIEEYGSAFYDMEKGDLSQSLSKLQQYKVHQINKELKMRNEMGFNAARKLVFSKMRNKKRAPSFHD